MSNDIPVSCICCIPVSDSISYRVSNSIKYSVGNSVGDGIGNSIPVGVRIPVCSSIGVDKPISCIGSVSVS
jgi:hypothetical protein